MVLAGLAWGRLRAKLDQLQMACDGRFTARHAQAGPLAQHPAGPGG